MAIHISEKAAKGPIRDATGISIFDGEEEGEEGEGEGPKEDGGDELFLSFWLAQRPAATGFLLSLEHCPEVSTGREVVWQIL